MNRVLIELHIPASDDHFDILAPIDVLIGKLNIIIANGVAEITNGIYVVSGCEQLCLKEPEGILNPMLTLQDYGVTDGTQLYLI